MRAIVLVGGFGTRLRPLTDTVPKSMLPVAHVPLIVRLIGQLERGGVDAVTLALGFLPEPFVDAFPDGRCGGVALDYAIESEPLDTAGAIRFAARHAGIDETFVVANGDVLTDLSIADLVVAHRAAGAEATIHLIPVEDPSAFGVVELDDAGRILRFVEKPAAGTEPSNLINAGTYVLEPSVLARIPSDRPVSIERETFPLIAAGGRFHSWATTDYWIDAGRPQLFLEANLDLINGRRDPAAWGESCEAVAAGATVHADASVVGSIIGDGSTVDRGATITASVLLPGAVIGADTVVDGSVVAGTVGRGVRLVRAVVGADAIIPDGEHHTDARIPEPTG
ncbi:MAG: NDP-sugar synthase [Ilumatobacteraceae bacterium]